MNELLAAVVGALAVVVVPTVGWFSQRVTREGRLLIRIDRLGAAYALLPDTAERSAFEEHLRRAASDLNEWLEPENKSVRLARRAVTVLLFVAVVALLSAYTNIAGIRDPAVTISLGLAGGAIAGVLSLVLGWLVERAMRSRKGSTSANGPGELGSNSRHSA